MNLAPNKKTTIKENLPKDILSLYTKDQKLTILTIAIAMFKCKLCFR
jgi:hypothetical protein